MSSTSSVSSQLDSLLPNVHSKFRSKEYWNDFFAQRKKAFEWYGDYADHSVQIERCLSCLVPTISGSDVEQKDMLVIGCGNSSFSADMYDSGFHRITNIDFSQVVIDEMLRRNLKRRSKMKWHCMDMLHTSFPDGLFSCIIDKGALDALMSDETKTSLSDASTLFDEIYRLLANSGVYICISLLQDHILSAIIDYFFTKKKDFCWKADFFRVDTKEQNSKFCPFFIALYKVSSDSVGTHGGHSCTASIFRTFFEGGIAQPDNDSDSVIDRVHAYQWKYRLLYGLRHLSPGECCQFDIHRTVDSHSSSTTPRYSVAVVYSDLRNRDQKGSSAVFLVPQGREHEWMFVSDEGRLQLASSCGYRRLIVVSLCRGEEYGDMSDVQAELSPKMVELVPQTWRSSKTKVPYLTLQEGIGFRKVIGSVHSEISGEMVVEEIVQEGIRYRRLVFSSNPNVIQSEAKLLSDKSGRIDFRALSCAHHTAMIAGFSLIGPFDFKEEKLPVSIIGLGAGSLAIALSRYFDFADVNVVELDPAVLEVANKYFGFDDERKVNDRLKVTIADGINYVDELFTLAESSPTSPNLPQFILLDVDGKNCSSGMSCPPEEFVTTKFLHKLRAVLLPKNGLLMINVVCRSKKAQTAVFSRIQSNFDLADYSVPTVWKWESSEDVNCVLFARAFSGKGDVEKLKRWVSFKSFLQSPIFARTSAESWSFSTEIERIIANIMPLHQNVQHHPKKTTKQKSGKPKKKQKNKRRR